LRFRVTEDVEAPADWVWGGFTDFSAIEAEVRASGADLVRVGSWHEAHLGASWRGSAPIRGRARPIESRICIFAPREALAVESRIGGMECRYAVSFVPLAARATRVSVVLDLQASTLSARLMLQSMKVARRRVLQRLEGAIVRQGQSVELDWRARASS
jgi:hypothetical protein